MFCCNPSFTPSKILTFVNRIFPLKFLICTKINVPNNELIQTVQFNLYYTFIHMFIKICQQFFIGLPKIDQDDMYIDNVKFATKMSFDGVFDIRYFIIYFKHDSGGEFRYKMSSYELKMGFCFLLQNFKKDIK